MRIGIVSLLLMATAQLAAVGPAGAQPAPAAAPPSRDPIADILNRNVPPPKDEDEPDTAGQAARPPRNRTRHRARPRHWRQLPTPRLRAAPGARPGPDRRDRQDPRLGARRARPRLRRAPALLLRLGREFPGPPGGWLDTGRGAGRRPLRPADRRPPRPAGGGVAGPAPSRLDQRLGPGGPDPARRRRPDAEIHRDPDAGPDARPCASRRTGAGPASSPAATPPSR